jgi:replicative DNA helicase
VNSRVERSAIPDGRVPPYSNEAERAVLGSILLNNQSMSVVASSLTPEHFYVEAHRRLYSAMITVRSAGSAIDAVTVGTYMQQSGDLEKVGGPMVFEGLTQFVATVANVEHYANIVSSLHAIRSMIYAAQQIVSDGFSGVSVEEVSSYLSNSRKAITEAAKGICLGNGPQHIDDTLHEIYKELESNEEPEGLIKTGIREVDESLGGLWPSLMTIIAGRPGMGKTALALNILMNAAFSGKKVLYITMEDTRQYLVRRLLARYADIDLNDIMLRRIKTKEQWSRLAEASSRLSGKKPVWIMDGGRLTSEQAIQIAASHQAEHGLDLVFIDHLGKVSDDTVESETLRIGMASRNISDGALELGVPVVLLSQLSRKVEERADKRPMLSDLRQSGEIEADARCVLFPFRPGYYVPGDEMNPAMQLIAAKVTHGRPGTMKLHGDMSRMYIRSWEYEDGIFPGESIDGTDATQVTRDRKRKPKQGSFFDKGEDYGGRDGY